MKCRDNSNAANRRPLLRGAVGRLRQPAAIAWTAAAVVVLGGISRADDPETAAPPALPAAAPIDISPERIDRLIAQMGDDNYFVREEAQTELGRIGFEAFDALVDAQESLDLEIASRARGLVERMQVEWTTPDDAPAVRELLKDYAQADEVKRLQLLEQLAAMPDADSVPVLCRMVRFDKSSVLARLAALALIEDTPADNDAARARAALVDQYVGRGSRPPLEWLRIHAAESRDPRQGVDRWGPAAEQEEKTLRITPQESSGKIVAALWRRQYEALKRIDDHDGAGDAVARMLAIDAENMQPLRALIDWLSESQPPAAFDQALVKFDEAISGNAVMLYAVAHAQQRRGRDELAAQAAQQALELGGDDQTQHLQVAFSLQRGGMLDWAEKEYRRAIELGERGGLTLRAYMILAEMLHDLARDAEAAIVLDEALASIADLEQDERVKELARVDATPDTMEARRRFFRASDLRRSGDEAAATAELLAGMDHAPTDIDLLIMLHRAAELDDAARGRYKKGMADCIEELRQDIRQMPDNPFGYNQLAWLLANTGGDAREAVELSEKSLELEPGSASYLDTLARCCLAAGQLDDALRHQTQALRNEPHSGLMQRQLAEIKAAIARRDAAGDSAAQGDSTTAPADAQ